MLEVGADSGDLVDEILDRKDIILAELLLEDGIRGEGEALVLDFAISTLVDELTDRFQVGLAGYRSQVSRGKQTNPSELCLPVGDIGLDQAKHLLGCLCNLDEDTVVDLEETEELKDFLRFGGKVVNTKMREISTST